MSEHVQVLLAGVVVGWFVTQALSDLTQRVLAVEDAQSAAAKERDRLAERVVKLEALVDQLGAELLTHNTDLNAVAARLQLKRSG